MDGLRSNRGIPHRPPAWSKSGCQNCISTIEGQLKREDSPKTEGPNFEKGSSNSFRCDG